MKIIVVLIIINKLKHVQLQEITQLKEQENKEKNYFKDIEALLKESAKHIEFLFRAGWSDNTKVEATQTFLNLLKIKNMIKENEDKEREI